MTRARYDAWRRELGHRLELLRGGRSLRTVMGASSAASGRATALNRMEHGAVEHPRLALVCDYARRLEVHPAALFVLLDQEADDDRYADWARRLTLPTASPEELEELTRRRLRELRNMPCTTVSRLLGVSGPMWARYESGEFELPALRAEMALRAFGSTLAGELATAADPGKSIARLPTKRVRATA